MGGVTASASNLPDVDDTTIEYNGDQLRTKTSVARIQRGTYTGDGTTDGSKAIAVAFRPQAVFISGSTTARTGWVIDGVDDNEGGASGDGGSVWTSAQVDISASGFAVKSNTTSNVNLATYYWVAYGGAV